MAALRGLLQSYRHLMEKDSTWLLLPARTKGNGGHGDVVAKYRTWMRELYSQCQDQLLVLVLHPQQAIAVSGRECNGSVFQRVCLAGNPLPRCIYGSRSWLSIQSFSC